MQQQDVEFKLSLKAIRTNMNLNQKEMAKELEVSPGTWFNWENGVTNIPGIKVKELSNLSGIPQKHIFLQ